MLYSSIKQLHEAQVFSVSMTSPNSVVDCDIYITAYAYSTVKNAQLRYYLGNKTLNIIP